MARTTDLPGVFAEALNQRDWERLGGLVAETVEVYLPGRLEPLRGRAVLRSYWRAMVTAFPDLRWEPERWFGDDTRLCVEGRLRGTHLGPLQSPEGPILPPARGHLDLRVCDVYRLEEEGIVEIRSYHDRRDLREQLGV